MEIKPNILFIQDKTEMDQSLLTNWIDLTKIGNVSALIWILSMNVSQSINIASVFESNAKVSWIIAAHNLSTLDWSQIVI